jgi:hypothetical protein
MLRSWMLAHDEILTRHPELSAALKSGLNNYGPWIARDALRRNPTQIPYLLAIMLRRYPSIALRVLVMDVAIPLAIAVRDRLRRVCRGTASPKKVETAQRFLTGDPEHGGGIFQSQHQDNGADYHER